MSMEPGVSMLHSQDLSNNPYSEPNSIPHNDTYFFKIISKNVFPSTLRPSLRSLSYRSN